MAGVQQADNADERRRAGVPHDSFRLGHALGPEPVDRAERMAMLTAHRDEDDQGDGRKPVTFDHAATTSAIRSALRPGTF